ncbi:hypothetical protein E4U43_003906 [Claviceps pusilla]|uniref:Uncharacterized protein n=1 Tax=Claviceps pusilla TaxID=123648 RepID=A0A9P7N677_9HYPO|nr:hypothetical protein E4U43_003906 [Claviceps pusilla]
MVMRPADVPLKFDMPPLACLKSSSSALRQRGALAKRTCHHTNPPKYRGPGKAELERCQL